MSKTEKPEQGKPTTPEPVKPTRLNKGPDGMKYKIKKILSGNQTTTEEVEADEIAYDRIGMRREGNRVVLDHIPTGWKIGQFKTMTQARKALSELIQVTDFNWIEVPQGIKAPVSQILNKYRS